MLWEADLQRIATRETDATPQALIDEQEVFRHVRLSSLSSEGWHRSVRLVKVRSNRSRIPWLFSSQRLSQHLQTIETFEARPNGSQLHSLSSGRDVHVCVAVPAVGSSGSESRSRFPTASRAFTAWASIASQMGHFAQTRTVDVLMVPLAQRARLLRTIQKVKEKYLRQCLAVGSVLEVDGAADDAPLVFVFCPRFVWFWRRSTSHGWPGGGDDSRFAT